MISACLERARARVGTARLGRQEGRVVRVSGLVVEASGIPSPVGTLCDLHTSQGVVTAEVVGFADGRPHLRERSGIGISPSCVCSANGLGSPAREGARSKSA